MDKQNNTIKAYDFNGWAHWLGKLASLFRRIKCM